jgi:maltose O-acetyltransferase
VTPLAAVKRRILTWVWQLVRRAEALQQDEWRRATLSRLAHCGAGVRLSGNSHFIRPECIRLGDNVHVGRNAWLRGDGGIEIGDNTHISRNVAIFSASHDYEGSRLPYDDAFVKRPVRIGRNVWIGMNAMIAPGVTIGDGAVVAMGAVVVKDVPPLAVVGGWGQRLLKHRDREHYEKLEAERRYGGKGGEALP